MRPLKRPFCQDRLGTKIGEVEKKGTISAGGYGYIDVRSGGEQARPGGENH
eukprot:COSAG06_NODE_49137_length_327_cov_0.921053_1_plen_50_part_10